jgi:molybdopterin-binding protein
MATCDEAEVMPEQTCTARAAARTLRNSLNTLRRWDRAGRIQTICESVNRRVDLAIEIPPLIAWRLARTRLNASNRLESVVGEVRVRVLFAGIQPDVATPAPVVAIATLKAADDVGSGPGAFARAVVKTTSAMIAAIDPGPVQ